MLNMSFRYGDIRDQSRKLSKIAKNFGRFFGRDYMENFMKFSWRENFIEIFTLKFFKNFTV